MARRSRNIHLGWFVGALLLLTVAVAVADVKCYENVLVFTPDGEVEFCTGYCVISGTGSGIIKWGCSPWQRPEI